MKCGESISLFWAYGGLGDSSSMRHVCRCLFHGDSGTSRITADQVRPATTANHSLLSNNPTYRCFVNPRIKKRTKMYFFLKLLTFVILFANFILEKIRNSYFKNYNEKD